MTRRPNSEYFLIDVISSCMLYCSDGVAHDAGAVNEGRRHDGSNSHVHRAECQQDELVRASLSFFNPNILIYTESRLQ